MRSESQNHSSLSFRLCLQLNYTFLHDSLTPAPHLNIHSKGILCTRPDLGKGKSPIEGYCWAMSVHCSLLSPVRNPLTAVRDVQSSVSKFVITALYFASLWS